jgi:hypothetical protein
MVNLWNDTGKPVFVSCSNWLRAWSKQRHLHLVDFGQKLIDETQVVAA